MNVNLLKVIDKYNDAFRDVVTGKLNKIPEEYSRYSEEAKKIFRLNKEEDFYFLLSAMDIIGDTNMAFSHFLEFGLYGATRYHHTGERYIRLYGVLNSSYIQQQAIINLCRICDVSPLSSVKEKIDRLNIRDIRHKLGAHSNDCLNQDREIESFVPVRMRMEEFTVLYSNTNKGDFHTADIKEYIKEHLQLIANLYDQIYEKFVNRIYKSNDKKIESLMKKIETVRYEKDGHSVIEIGKEKIILTITVDEPTSEEVPEEYLADDEQERQKID